MISRRELLESIAGTRMAAAVPAFAQNGPRPRVGFVATTPMFRDAFIDALAQLGYQDGRNVQVEWRPNPRGERRDIEELVKLSLACLVLSGPMNLRHGRELTASVPIVAIDLESDPVADGFAASLAHPGGNVTGVFLDLPELAAKRLSTSSFFAKFSRGSSGSPWCWQDPVGGHQLRAVQDAARTAGVTPVSIGVRTTGDVSDVVGRGMAGSPQAVLVLTGPLLFPHRVEIVDSSRRHGLPLASVFPTFAEAGAVLGYGPNQVDLYRLLATYVDRILKGSRPADLPIQRPVKFELILNVKTMKAFRLTTPPSLLARAEDRKSVV